MSDATGTVVRNGVVIAFFEYIGVSDVCCAKTYPTTEELSDNWREAARDYWSECKCDPPEWVEVELFTEYGGGGKVCDSTFCMKCKLITGDRTEPGRFE